jgi:hypothetical protein
VFATYWGRGVFAARVCWPIGPQGERRSLLMLDRIQIEELAPNTEPHLPSSE